MNILNRRNLMHYSLIATILVCGMYLSAQNAI